MKTLISRWKRRFISISILIASAIFYFTFLPLLIVFSVLYDIYRWSQDLSSAAFRSLLFLGLVIFFEILGIGWAFVIWIPSLFFPSSAISWNYSLQHFWNAGILYGFTKLFRLQYTVEAAEALQKGGYLLLCRHGSGFDYTLPMVLAGVRHKRKIRYVLQESMRWDPCIDIVGTRLPTAFVKPGSGERERQDLEVAKLGVNLGHDDAIVIYPEGSRFSSKRRETTLHRLKANGNIIELDWALRLQKTLIPRMGAITALLKTAPPLDVVFMAHHGLEQSSRMSDIIHGSLLGTEVKVRLWRIPAAEVPTHEISPWMYSQWLTMDHWLREQ